jgi:hypothetical protein
LAATGQQQSLNYRMASMSFQQYDVAKLKGLRVPLPDLFDEFNLRRPIIGDVVTIIEIYSEPPGYELECSDSDGITQWMMAFRPEDVELELLS